MGFIKRRDPNKHPGFLTPQNTAWDDAESFVIVFARVGKLPAIGRSLRFTAGRAQRSLSARTSKSGCGLELLMIG